MVPIIGGRNREDASVGTRDCSLRSQPALLFLHPSKSNLYTICLGEFNGFRFVHLSFLLSWLI